MSELKLFTTPAEEMDLASLRSRVTQLYANAFKRICLVNYPNRATAALEVLDICEQTIEEANKLAAAHKEKWKDK